MMKVTIIWVNTKWTIFENVVYFDMHCEKGKEILAISQYGDSEIKYFDMSKVYKFRCESI